MKSVCKIVFAISYISVISFIIILSTVPPVSRDAQTHHLALPKLWLSQGLLSEVRDMEFSYYPQLVDLLYLLPVALDMDIFAKYIHFAFGLGTLLLIYLYIKRSLGKYWGLLGGLIYITIPVIVKLSVTVYVDLGLLFFFTASLTSMLIWLEDTDKLRWLIIAGVCSGLALSTKYNAILSVTLLTLLLGYFFLKTRLTKNNQQFRMLAYIALFSIIAVLVYSPWLVRNFHLTGNPIYPLHDSLFNNKDQITNDNLTEEDKFESALDNVKPLTLRRLVYNESLPYSLALPFRIFIEGQDDNAQYFDGRLNPLLLLFPLLLFLSKKSKWQFEFMSIFVVLTLLYTMLAVEMRIRYIITIISPLVILSVFGLHQFSEWLVSKFRNARLSSAVIVSLVMFYFSFNFPYIIDLYKKIDPFSYISGELSRDEYISKKLPYYELNKMANKLVKQDNYLLGIYTGNRRYYIDVPLILQSNLLFQLSEQVRNPYELYEKISERNISHILIRMDLFNGEFARREERKRGVLSTFFDKHLNLLQSNELFSLYEVVSKSTKQNK